MANRVLVACAIACILIVVVAVLVLCAITLREVLGNGISGNQGNRADAIYGSTYSPESWTDSPTAAPFGSSTNGFVVGPQPPVTGTNWPPSVFGSSVTTGRSVSPLTGMPVVAGGGGGTYGGSFGDRTPQGSTWTMSNGGQQPDTWFNDACNLRRCPKGWSTLPTLVISMDGFRADYLRRNLTSALQRLIECGSHTPYMFPSYPSKTYPNHYAMATGLYPESHGIIDNQMYDGSIEPASDRLFDISQNSSASLRWWGGEPIWNTVVKNGLKSAVCYWPGSDVPIQNMTPTYWATYDESTPFITRVNRVIDWLLMDDSARPSLVAVYFNEPDSAGHQFGPMSDEVNNQLVMVDGFINHLLTRLYQHGLFHCVNKIILADHGMVDVNSSNFVSLSDFVPYEQQTSENMRVFSGPVARIQLDNTAVGSTVDRIVEATRCKDDRFRVYKRLETPKRLHYSATPRIGDLVMDADPGVEIYENGKPNRTKTGDHGYDYKAASMHALFLAHGPAFHQNRTIAPFQNVELYNMIAELLGVRTRAPNNGTEGSLNAILRNPPPPPPSRAQLVQPPQCPVAPTSNGGDPGRICGECGFLNQKSIEECSQPRTLAKLQPINGDGSRTLCQFEKQSLIYDSTVSQPTVLQSLITERTTNIGWDGNACSILRNSQSTRPMSQCSDVDSVARMLTTKEASMWPLHPFDSGQNTCAADWHAKGALFDGFFKGVWSQLQDLTLQYANRFGGLLIVSGTIYDYDGDGRADSYDVIRQRASNVTGTGNPSTIYLPSHAYQILLRCTNGQWSMAGACSGIVDVLSFVLPNRSTQDNCQPIRDYLSMHTARVRDIELLTGLEFFSEWPFETAVRLRIHVNQEFW